MFMGAIDRGRRDRIWLYKHIETRRYLNIDAAGHAYRYIPPLFDRDGRYIAHRRLADALAHLELEIVPMEWRKMTPRLRAMRTRRNATTG
jgi:hypothetical protein